MLYNHTRYDKKIEARKTSVPENSTEYGTAKGFFAEAIRMNGIFIRWFAGEHLANCHKLWRAIGFFIKNYFMKPRFSVVFLFIKKIYDRRLP